MQKIYICDDSEMDRERVCKMLKKYVRQFLSKISVKKFDDAGRMLEELEKAEIKPSLIFLDIYMGKLSGMEAGRQIYHLYNKRIPIIFSTSSEKYAIEAFRLHAVGYLHKPYTYKEFEHAMKRIEKLFVDSGRFLEVREKSQERIQRIYFDDIVYMESEDRITVLHIIDRNEKKEIRSRIPLREYREKLEKESEFYICGSSYILNLNHVIAMEEGGMKMDNAHLIIVPVRLRKEAAAELKNWRESGGHIYL